LNAALKKFIPGWKGVDDPESLAQYRAMPDKVRKKIKAMMDVNFRDRGGLTQGEARVAISDPSQFNSMEGGIQNIGRIDTDAPIAATGNPTFPASIPGEGLGTVESNPGVQDVSIFELIPDARIGKDQRLVATDVNALSPKSADLRALQMKPYAGLVTPEILGKLQDRGVNVNSLPLVAIIGAATAYGLLGAEDAQAEEVRQ
jgi:hypothetical protein